MWICDGNNTEQLCIKPYGFLVRIFFVFLKKSSQMDFCWYRKFKIDSESLIFMYLGNLNCNSFIWNSFMTPIPPLTLGPQKPWIFTKIWQLFNYLVMELHKENSILCFILLGGGIKLATTYIEVRVEGQRTTPDNQSRDIRKTSCQDVGYFIFSRAVVNSWAI